MGKNAATEWLELVVADAKPPKPKAVSKDWTADLTATWKAKPRAAPKRKKKGGTGSVVTKPKEPSFIDVDNRRKPSRSERDKIARKNKAIERKEAQRQNDTETRAGDFLESIDAAFQEEGALLRLSQFAGWVQQTALRLTEVLPNHAGVGPRNFCEDVLWSLWLGKTNQEPPKRYDHVVPVGCADEYVDYLSGVDGWVGFGFNQYRLPCYGYGTYIENIVAQKGMLA